MSTAALLPSAPSLPALLASLNYPKPARTALFTDLPTLLSLYPTLIFRQIIHEKGHSWTTYLALEGTLPVKYDSRMYSLPIRVLFERKFPDKCPVVHLVPQEGMQIAHEACRWVTAKGIVTIPFMNEWKKQKRSVLALLDSLKTAFGEEMPIYQVTLPMQPTDSLNSSEANLQLCDLDASHVATHCCFCRFPLPRLCDSCKAVHATDNSRHVFIPCGKALEISNSDVYSVVAGRCDSYFAACDRVKSAIFALETEKTRIETDFLTVISGLKEKQAVIQGKITALQTALLMSLEKATENIVSHTVNSSYRLKTGSIAEVVWKEVAREEGNRLKLAEMKARIDADAINRAVNVTFVSDIPEIQEIIQRNQLGS